MPRQFLVLAATAVLSVAVTAITPAFSASMGGQRPGDSVTLSPQPLPPRNLTTTRPGGAVMLSPQPLPPRILKNGAGAIR